MDEDLSEPDLTQQTYLIPLSPPPGSINVRPKLENGRISRIFPATDAAAAAGIGARDDQDDG